MKKDNTQCLNLIFKENYIPPNWIKNYQLDFLYKFLCRLNWTFNKINSILIFSIINNVYFENFNQNVYKKKIKKFFSNTDIYKIFFFIENFSLEYNIISELFPLIAKILVWEGFNTQKFLLSEILLLISLGFQYKTPGDIVNEFNYKTEDIVYLSKEIFKKFIYFYFK